MKYFFVAYALAISVWNAVFTGLLVGLFNIIYALTGHPLLGKLDIIIAYLIGYIVLFVLNVKILDDEDE